MDYLKDFYNERIKTEWLTDFDEITEDEKKHLRGSLSFAGYKLGRHIDELKQAIKESFPFKYLYK